MTVRASSEDQRNALKMAFRISVKHGGGGEVISAFTRVLPPILSTYAAPHEKDRFAPLDVALDVDIAMGEPINATALAAAQGYELVRCTDVLPNGRLGIADVSTFLGANNELACHALAALSDNSLDANEKLLIKSDIAKLRSILTRLEQKVDA